MGRNARVWGMSPEAPGTYRPTWFLEEESAKQMMHRRKGIVLPGTAIIKQLSAPALQVAQTSAFERRMARRREPLQNRVLSQSWLRVKRQPSSLQGKLEWDDDFHQTYSNRFNGNCHRDFRQYFGVHTLHNATLGEVNARAR